MDTFRDSSQQEQAVQLYRSQCIKPVNYIYIYIYTWKDKCSLSIIGRKSEAKHGRHAGGLFGRQFQAPTRPFWTLVQHFI